MWAFLNWFMAIGVVSGGRHQRRAVARVRRARRQRTDQSRRHHPRARRENGHDSPTGIADVDPVALGSNGQVGNHHLHPVGTAENSALEVVEQPSHGVGCGGRLTRGQVTAVRIAPFAAAPSSSSMPVTRFQASSTAPFIRIALLGMRRVTRRRSSTGVLSDRGGLPGTTGGERVPP